MTEERKDFNRWFVSTFSDPDGQFTHLPKWLKADLWEAWQAGRTALWGGAGNDLLCYCDAINRYSFLEYPRMKLSREETNFIKSAESFIHQIEDIFVCAECRDEPTAGCLSCDAIRIQNDIKRLIAAITS